VSVARFIADQRTKYQVPHVLVCALLGVSLGWFYNWIARASGRRVPVVCTRLGTVAATPWTAR